MSDKETGCKNQSFEQEWLLTDGMTLRDYFAGQAVIELLSHCNGSKSDIEITAIYSYDVADAMLKERDK